MSLLIFSVAPGAILMLYPVWVTLVLTSHRNLVYRKELDRLLSPSISYTIFYYVDSKVWAIQFLKSMRGEVDAVWISMHSCALFLARVLQTLLRRSTTIRLVWSILFEKTTVLYRHQGVHFQALCGVLAMWVPSTSMGLKQPNPHALHQKCTSEGPIHSSRNNTSHFTPKTFASVIHEESKIHFVAH